MNNKYVFVTVMHDGGSSILQYILSNCKQAATFTRKNKDIMEWGRYASRPVYTVTKDGRLMCEEKEIHQNRDWPWPVMKKKFDTALHNEQKYKLISKSYPGAAFILKDPVSVILARLINENFPGDSRFIIMVRDPYSVIESTSRKLTRSLKGQTLDQVTKRATTEWIDCQKEQMLNVQNIEKSIWFRYEDLFDNKNMVMNKIQGLVSELSDINLNIHMKKPSVTREGPLVNLNTKQRKALTKNQIVIINEQLKNERDLLDFWGYQLWTNG